MPVPTPRLALALSLAVVVIVAADDPAGFWVANAAVLGLVLVDWALAPRPSSVTVERHGPEVVVVGRSAEIAWQVSHTRQRALRVGIADELAPSLHAGSRRATVTVAPGTRSLVSTTITPSRRGRFDPNEITVRTFGPLGLLARQSSIEIPGRLSVHPSFDSRAEAEMRIDRSRILEVGLRSAKGRGGGTEFDQLRDYRPDDEFRHIDWSATARTGAPVVRTFHAERNQTVVCLLDNGRVMAGRVEGVPRVEHAMDAVMALTTVATRLGDRAGLVAFDREVRSVVPPGQGPLQLGRVTEAMYDLEPALVESDHRQAFTQTLARFGRRMLLVVLTDLTEHTVREMLQPALPVILRHHLVLVAAVSDPQLQRWAGEKPEDEHDAYRKAAAVAARTQRARVRAQLERLGARVVDAPPARLAPELADAYLRAKATGSL